MPKTSRTKDTAVRTAVRKLLGEYFTLLRKFFVAMVESGDQPATLATLSVGEDVELVMPGPSSRVAIIERVIEVLGEGFEIPDPGQLEALIVERWLERQPAGSVFSMDEGVLDALTADICQPLREYAFSVQCSGFAQMPYNIQFTGLPLLRLVAVEKESEPGLWRHDLEGKVQAWSCEDAAGRAETVLEEFLGACITLGMTLTFPLRKTQAPPAHEQIRITPAAWKGRPIYLDVNLSVLTCRTVFQVPASLSDLESYAFGHGDSGQATTRLVSTLNSLFSQSGPSGSSLRTALRFFCRGVSAHEYGLAVFNWFTALEGVLLDPEAKADIQARLVEAVTFSLGTGASERTAIRKDVKRLYDDRSRFVHSGYAVERPGMRAKCAELIRRVLEREIHCHGR